MNNISDLESDIIKSNYSKKYIDTNLRSMSNNSEELLLNAKEALKGVLLNSNNKLFKGTPPNLVRGVCCELMLRYCLEDYFTKNNLNFAIFDNVLLWNDYIKSTTQIDTIIITNSCIAVIEAKSIYGVSRIYDGKIETYYGNNGKVYSKSIEPWKQNMSHILTLKEELEKLNSHLGKIFYENIVFVYGIGKIQMCELGNNQTLITINSYKKTLDDIFSKQRYNKIDNETLKRVFKYLRSKSHSIWDEINHVNQINKIKK